MKKNLSDYLVALTVIVCSLVLLGALTYALSGRRVSASDRTLEVDYPDVTGIKLHSEVRYAGAIAGTVTHIRLLTFEERQAGDTEEKKHNAVRVTLTPRCRRRPATATRTTTPTAAGQNHSSPPFGDAHNAPKKRATVRVSDTRYVDCM